MNNNSHTYLLAYLVPVTVLLAFFTYFIYFANQDLDNSLPKIGTTSNEQPWTVENSFNQNDFARTHLSLNSTLKTDPNNIEALLLKAQTLAQEASLTLREKELGDEARSIAFQVLKLDPNNVRALTLIGYSYEIQENYPAAHKYYEQALLLDPNNSEVHSQNGHAYQLEGKTIEAESSFGKAFAIDSTDLLANFGLAKIYANSGKLEEAKTLFLFVGENSLNIRQSAEGYHSAGIITEFLLKQVGSSELTPVQELAKKAIQKDPSYPQAYVLLAKTLFFEATTVKSTDEKQKLITSSFTNIYKAIELNPKLAYAHLELATQMFILNEIKNTQLILKNLPKIIEEDISLNSNEKDTLNKVVANLQNNISKK